jgi:DNA helicase II / ATP-dependent DNA helicase PcrA
MLQVVLVDEAQDLSPLNHQQLLRCAGEDGPGAARIIVVGDPRQAIYAFRGADSESMKNILLLRRSWVELSLKLSFRCPKVIIRRQEHHAPGFMAAESNTEGVVEDWTGSWVPRDGHKFGAWPTGLGENSANETSQTWAAMLWSWEQLEALCESHGARAGSCAMLCRNNAPLFAVAMELIRKPVKVQMLGRGLLKGLLALSDRVCGDDATGREECLQRICDWRQQAKSKAGSTAAPGSTSLSAAETAALAAAEAEAEAAADYADCLVAVFMGGGRAGPCATAGEMRDRLRSLFDAASSQVTLSTVHQAKGMEWDVVVHLDPWRIPHKAAEQEGGAVLQQEHNLLYVAETRVRRALVLADVKGLVGGGGVA